jgi:hypothetical protein
MTHAIAGIKKPGKKIGRPKTGIGPNIGLRLYPDLEARLDAWIAKQDEPDLGRPEAIRRLLDEVLPSFAAQTAEAAKPRSRSRLAKGSKT